MDNVNVNAQDQCSLKHPYVYYIQFTLHLPWKHFGAYQYSFQTKHILLRINSLKLHTNLKPNFIFDNINIF